MQQAAKKDKEKIVIETKGEPLVKNQLRYIQVRNFRIRVPNSPNKRMWLGIGLTVIGIFPGPPGPAASIVGISILSIDNPRLRKVRRKSTIWIGRKTWARDKGKKEENGL